jgi:HMG (high mobility group) box
MVKRHQRDPGAPKRNMSAYLLYQNAMREQFKALNPGKQRPKSQVSDAIPMTENLNTFTFPMSSGMTFGQLSKYTSAMYSELPPTEKEAWVARAEADKARYLHELSTYIPPPGYDPKGDAIQNPVQPKQGRKGKPEKDVNAPKRNMSAYLLYQNAMRE